MMATEGHPVVYGDWLHANPRKPTVLIYGHFDVQPAEPYDLWQTPPFLPKCGMARSGVGGFRRQGGMLIPILSVEALLKTTGSLPVNVKFFFEGQEEIGSPHLSAFIAANGPLLKADMIFSADGKPMGRGSAQPHHRPQGSYSRTNYSHWRQGRPAFWAIGRWHRQPYSRLISYNCVR